MLLSLRSAAMPKGNAGIGARVWLCADHAVAMDAHLAVKPIFGRYGTGASNGTTGWPEGSGGSTG